MHRPPDFGSRRIYYNNFASHLLNAYSPNMLYPELPYAMVGRRLAEVNRYDRRVWL